VNPDQVAKRLHIIHQRIDGLANGVPILDEAIEDLRTALEEVRVADEQLRQQNEELAAAHLEVEVERQRYRELFNLAPDAYLVTDLTGIITEANLSAAHLLRMPHRTLPGKALATYIAKPDRVLFRSLVSRPELGSGPHPVPFRLQPRQAEPIEAELTYSVGCGVERQPNAIRWLIRDISEHTRTADRIRALNSELETRVVERTADLRSAQRLAEDLLVREQAARRAAGGQRSTLPPCPKARKHRRAGRRYRARL
jgi:PAS domain S-box-containing protein